MFVNYVIASLPAAGAADHKEKIYPGRKKCLLLADKKIRRLESSFPSPSFTTHPDSLIVLLPIVADFGA